LELKNAGGNLIQCSRCAAASRDAIEGEHEGALTVRLTAPPVDDRANDSLRRFWPSV
jgi:uncharacterized protein YggU (UPF0235/DUF167 family)